MSNVYRFIGPLNENHILLEDRLQYIVQRVPKAAPKRSIAYFADQGREGLRRHLTRRGIQLSEIGEATLQSIPNDAEVRRLRKACIIDQADREATTAHQQ